MSAGRIVNCAACTRLVIFGQDCTCGHNNNVCRDCTHLETADTDPSPEPGPLFEVRNAQWPELQRVHFWCPACEDIHAIRPGTWEWDPNTLTVSPSILVQGPKVAVCHSFLRNGQWEFLSDSTHHLAGQTVPAVPIPEGLHR